MSTRGMYGIRKHKVDKMTYNHMDSYPSCLGSCIINFIKNVSDDDLVAFFNNIILVNEDDIPTDEDIKTLKNSGQYEDRSPKDDWYTSLRNSQGNFQMYEKIIKARKKVYMTDDGDFIKDSSFCDYAYVINLDTMQLEFWKGRQKKPWKNNRYGTKCVDGYYPCQMAAAYSFEDVRRTPKDEIVSMAEEAIKALKKA